ncbi:MAG: universal stress protein [Dehalococcoidales bacterium]|nr:universal stress protein [Dehalococcoidales bacterium]
MLDKILVPLDGSELSELALPYAEELAGAFNSDVELVYVCEPEESKYRHMHQLYIEKIAAQVRIHIRAYPGREAGLAAKVKAVVLDGEAADEIIDYADKNDISLIIMVSHGRSGIMPWAMGGTAMKVIQRTDKSVLLARAGCPQADAGKLFSRILVPLDGSDDGEAPLPYIKEITRKLESEVVLLQVVAPGQHVHTVGGLDYILFPEDEVERTIAEARQYLEQAGKELADTKVTLKSEVKTGNAAQEIIDFADEANICLVAISTHEHSGAGRWTLGNVAHKILQAGHTSVLQVRAPGVKS